MNCIVVTDQNWGIGKDNALLTHLPGDLQYFKAKTLGKVLIMGRKTVESLRGGKPLPDRTTIILTTSESYAPPAGGGEFIICHSLSQLVDILAEMEKNRGIDAEEDVFVAGGMCIYDKLMPYCQQFFVTKIEAAFAADKHFQNLDRLAEAGEVKMTWQSEPMQEKGLAYTFTKYERQQ